MNQDVNLLKYLATVDSSIGKLYDKLIKELAKIGASITDLDTGKLFSFADYPQVKDRVEKILDKYTASVESRITNGMNDAIDMSYLANTTFLKDYSKLSDKAIKTQREKAKEAFIRSRSKSKDGLGLSNRVWNYTNQAKAEFEAGMSEVLEDGLSSGISAEELGRKVRDKLKYPEMVYKRYHLKKLTKEGKKDVIEWRKKIVDEDGKVRFIKTELDMVGRGVYRSSRKNTLRLAATEINMAYRYADNVRWQSEPFIRGIRIRLSGNHTLNGKPFYDICDELQGDYPKSFMWSGWHPRCYSDDSEVLTSDGWKLFKDVTLFDGIPSLNPNNKEVEFVSIVSLFKWYNNGVMVRIYGSGIDYLVTEDHEILIENNGKIGRVQASSFDCSSNSLLDCSCDLRKDIIEYHGYVYDLELERNHIMYIRRNGKCFWGSNCRCSASPILIPQEEMDKISKLSEDEYQNYRPKDLITEMPDKFKSWFEQNKDKIEASIKRGTQPYFIRDNNNLIRSLLPNVIDTNSVDYSRIDGLIRPYFSMMSPKQNEYGVYLASSEDTLNILKSSMIGYSSVNDVVFSNKLKEGAFSGFDRKTGILYISDKSMMVGKDKTFNPAQSLRSAMAKIQANKSLSFDEEYSFECVYHELMHSMAKGWRSGRVLNKVKVMESVNQVCAREYYGLYIKKFGIKPEWSDEIKSNGYGYHYIVSKLNDIIDQTNIKRSSVIRRLKNIIINNHYDDIRELLETQFKKYGISNAENLIDSISKND